LAAGCIPADLHWWRSNSTISGNFAGTTGGGISSNITFVSLSNSTVAFNGAGFRGAGVYSHLEDVVSTSSIIAHNVAAAQSSDVYLGPGRAFVGDHNLILQANVPLPIDTITADPRLGPLVHQGGATRIHTLLPDSPAIDKGANSSHLVTDQRSGAFKRETPNGAADIGAFERQAFDDDAIYEDAFEL
jgi:hypothetical protein